MPILLSSALLDRGVLLEVRGQDIYLTDNLYFRPPRNNWVRHNGGPLDTWMIGQLLRSLELNERIAPSPDPNLPWLLEQPDRLLDDTQIQCLFDQPHHQEEVCGPGHWRCGLKQFKRHAHGPKLPLALLDPHIAILVKGYSAVGCFSYCACQGYTEHDGQRGRQPLRVDLIDRINSDWARHLLDKARASDLKLPDLIMNGQLLIETDASLESPERDMQRLWRQAISLGRFMYDNRVALRGERRIWAEAYPSENEKHPRDHT